MIYGYNVQCHKSNHSINIRIISFAINEPHIWRRFTYNTWKDFSPLFHHKLKVNIFSCWFSSYKDKDGSEKPDDCALFFNWWWRRTPSSRSSKSILRSWCMAQNVDPLVHRCQLLHQSDFWKRWSWYCSRSWWSFISKQSVYQPNTTLSYSYMMYKRKCLVKLDQERDTQGRKMKKNQNDINIDHVQTLMSKFLS